MTIIESIQTYFKTSPFFNGESIAIDPISDDNSVFALNTTDSESLVKKYADGGKLCKYDFLLSLTRGQNEPSAQEILDLYESLADWLDGQNSNNKLPQLSGNKSAYSIETLNHGHLVTQDENKRIYQVQCRLVYYINNF